MLSAPGVKKDEPQPSQSPSPEVSTPETVDNNSDGNDSDTGTTGGQGAEFGGSGVQGASPVSGGGSGGGLAVTGANVETLTPWILFLLANGLIVVWRARCRSVEKMSRTQ